MFCNDPNCQRANDYIQISAVNETQKSEILYLYTDLNSIHHENKWNEKYFDFLVKSEQEFDYKV
jgi:hypothetical protein